MHRHAFKVLKEDLTLSFFPSEEPQMRAFVNWEIQGMPIQKGAKVGEVRLIDETGALLVKGDLFAQEAVKGKFFFLIKEWFRQFF